jgi:Lsr2
MEATMATKITVVLEDDLDGGPADETVRFGIGGTEYEIDLSATNAAAFRRQFAPFIEHAAAGRAADSGTGRGGLPPAGSAARASGLGERPGHRAQRPRPHPRRRCRAIRSRHRRTLTPAHLMAGPKHPGQPLARRPVNDARPEDPCPLMVDM